MDQLAQLQRAVCQIDGQKLPKAVISRLTRRVCQLEIHQPLPAGVVLKLGSCLMLVPPTPKKGDLVIITTVQELGQRRGILYTKQKLDALAQIWRIERGFSGLFFNASITAEDTPGMDSEVYAATITKDVLASSTLAESMMEDFVIFSERYRRRAFREE